MALTVKQIVEIIEELAPKSLAMPGDPTGLQCGDLRQEVKRIMFSLDASLETVDQAVEAKADLLVTHHPLLFEPVNVSNVGRPENRALIRAFREGLTVYSAHTNLDASPWGINASFAELLGLNEQKFLQECVGDSYYKVVVFVPEEHLENVRSAAFEAGGGQIGQYSGCSFSVEGEGTFHPGDGTLPAKGQPGRNEKVREVRLEINVPSRALGAVLTSVREAHPYEVPAIDVYPAKDGTQAGGFGITGVLPRSMTAGQVASMLGSLLKTGPLRLVGKKGTRVRMVALCAGSGASLLDAAVQSGAHLFITGDMKYHEARKAEDAGIVVLDAGHFAPEKFGFSRFGKLLEDMFVRSGAAVEVLFAREKDPFIPVQGLKA